MDDRAQGLSREATVSLFQPARNTILLLLGTAALSAPLLATFAGHVPSLGLTLRFGAMFLAAAIIALSQFRDPLLAIAGALAPLPGVSLIYCGAFETPSPEALGALAYVLGFSVALIAGDSFTSHIADGDDPKTSAILTLQNSPHVLAPILAAGLALPALLMLTAPERLFSPALLLAGGNALAALSGWLVVPLAGSFLSGSEDFIVRINRSRESWSRRLERVAHAARPPWAMSASGILLVLLVLGVFGDARLVVGKDMAVALRTDVAGALVILLAVAFLAGRGWRRAAGVFFATAGVALFGLWGFARTGAVLDGSLMLLTAGLCSICFVPIASIAARASQSARSDASGASEAGILNGGPAAVAVSVASLILLAPWYRQFGVADAGFVLAILFAAGGALAFQPALGTALEEFFPGKQTLAERYRVK
jgi:hypothetical protein